MDLNNKNYTLVTITHQQVESLELKSTIFNILSFSVWPKISPKRLLAELFIELNIDLL